MSERGVFEPKWTSPPGQTLADILVERRISEEDFSASIGRSLTETRQLLSGEVGLDPSTATQVAAIVGGSKQFWCNREAQYRSAVLRVAESESKVASRNWLAALPLNEMQKLNWVPRSADLHARLCAAFRFFGISSIEEWPKKYSGFLDRVALRTSPTFVSHAEALIAWLRFGEIEAAKRPHTKWDSEQFSLQLTEIRKLTRKRSPDQFLPDLTEQCQSCGVVVVVSQVPSECKASGATYFTRDGRPILMLSFRYRSDDHFWFTFFHEAGHLLLHSEELCFVEFEGSLDTQQECEANDFAGEILIPRANRDAMMQLGSNAKRIMRFARDVGVSPGIVVGQMQHHGVLGPQQQSGLKRRYLWKDNRIV